MKQRALVLCVVFALSAGCERRGSGDTDTQGEMDQMHRQLDQANQRLAQAEQNMQALQQRSEMAQAQNAQLRTQLQTMGAQMQQTRAQIQAAQRQARVQRAQATAIAQQLGAAGDGAPDPARHPAFGPDLTSIRDQIRSAGQDLAGVALHAPQ